MKNSNNHFGTVVQIFGPVVDVQFQENALPPIFTALRLTNPTIDDRQGNLTLEVAQHLGENIVRTIAMDSTDGSSVEMEVENTGGPLKFLLNGNARSNSQWVGDPIDERGKIDLHNSRQSHRDPPQFQEYNTQLRNSVTGIKVIDLLAPYVKGGKNWSFRWSRSGKNRYHQWS